MLLLCEDGVHEHLDEVWLWGLVSTKTEIRDYLHEETNAVLLDATNCPWSIQSIIYSSFSYMVFYLE